MITTFTTNIKAFGNNTGIEVPEKNIKELGKSKKPAVKVDVAGYSYLSTIAVMGDTFMISLSKAHREAAGLKAGDEVEVTLELETSSRIIDIPNDFAKALLAAGVKEAFDNLAPSKRKEFIRQINEAKTEETSARRMAKIIGSLSS